MLVWLTKKLAVAADGGSAVGDGERPTAVAWQDGLLAVAGLRSAAAPANGGVAPPQPTLRLLHLAEPDGDGAPSALPPSVARETVLRGHDAPVRVAAFNDASGKLATGDDAGTVVVWGERDATSADAAGPGSSSSGAWAQELANRRRGHGPVVAARWRSDGEVVALGWRDGSVVVGTAAGRRLWARDDVTGGRGGLSCVAWAPDGHVLLFACGVPGLEPAQSSVGPAVLAYSAQGSPLGFVPLPALALGGGGGLQPPATPHVVAVEWAAARASDPSARGLAVVLSNGRLQLMPDESDAAPVLVVDAGIEVTAAAWSPDGGLLALAGVTTVPAENGSTGGMLEVASLVRFYDGDGRLRGELALPRATAAVPADTQLPSLQQQANDCKTSALCWDPSGLRLAICAGPSVLFAAVRPPYRWAAVGDRCLVAAFHTPDSEDACCAFIDTVSGERTAKHVRRLMGVHGPPGGGGDVCVLACAPDPAAAVEQQQQQQQQQVAAAGAGTPQQPSPSLLQPTTTAYGAAAALYHQQQLLPASEPGPSPPHTLVACDALGAPLASATVALRPDFVAVTDALAVTASVAADGVAVWQFDSGDGDGIGGGSTPRADAVAIMFVLDAETGRATPMRPDAAPPLPVYGHAITAVAAAGDCVLVGRESGSVDRYRWAPPATLAHVARYSLRCRPGTLQLNCDATCFGVTDDGNVASIFDMTVGAPAAGSEPNTSAALSLDTSEAPVPLPQGQHLPQEWPDAWALLWSDDAPDTWCVSVKGHLVTGKGTVPNEPVPSLGYPARFHDLTVTCALLDRLLPHAAVRDQLAGPAGPPLQPGSVTAAHELPSVAAMRQLLREAPPDATHGRALARATAHAVAHDHVRLWALLSEAALQHRCWSVAERAYAALRDPAGVQIVRRLAGLPEPWHQRAEVDALAGRVDDAEAAYTGAGRLDLAVQLRSRLGHWQRVLELLTTSTAAAATDGGGNGDKGSETSDVDARLMRTAHLRTGDYWADRQQWRRAIPHYAAAGAHEALVECYTRADDYAALAALAGTLPPGAPLAVDVGTRLASAGLVEDAAAAFLCGGDPRSAVAAAAAFHRWELASQLGRHHGLTALVAQLRVAAAAPTAAAHSERGPTPTSGVTTTMHK